MRITVLGDGGWGTTLAIHLSKKGNAVRLWGAFPDYIETVKASRENTKFLPGVMIPANVTLLSDINDAGRDAELIVLAVPSQHARRILANLKKSLNKNAVVLSVTKGIENSTNKRISELISEILDSDKIAVLSGPSIAYEVARDVPATVVISSRDKEICRKLQDVFNTEKLRIYTSDDMVGVELGGALKNIIAIAAGIGDGLGLGTNAKAATVTRGLAEISRLGEAMGARKETFSGLSGIGDLITTCINPHGRNRWLGEELGRGRKAKDILGGTEMVVEGAATVKSAYELAKKYKVDMPITAQVYEVIYNGKDPRKSVHDLMTRTPKSES